MTHTSSAQSRGIRRLTARIFTPQGAGFAALIISASTLVSYILGMVRDIVLANYFGAGIETDVYNAGFIIPDTLQTILIISVTSSSFIPIFSDYKNNFSLEEANRLASNFINTTLIFFIGVCVVCGVFMPGIVEYWLPTASAEKKEMVASFSRIILLSQVAFAFSKVFSGVLQTHKHFVAFALSLWFYNICIIGAMILFHDRYGIYSAAMGAVVGAAIVTLINLIDLAHTNFKFSLTLAPAQKAIGRIYSLAIPNALNLGVWQLTMIIYSSIAFTLPEGNWSAFNYARNFQSFPVSLFGIAVATAIFPFLSENTSQKSFDNFNYNMEKSGKQILFLTVPSAVGLALLAEQIVTLVLARGEFGSVAVQRTSAVLVFYAVSIPLESMVYLYAKAFYANKDTLTPLLVKVGGTALNLGLSYYLATRYGAAAFSIGFTSGMFLQVLVLMFTLRLRVKSFRFGRFWINAAKISASAAVMGIAVYLTSGFLESRSLVIRLFLSIAAGTAVYFALTILLKCADIEILQKLWQRFWRRNAG